MNQKIQQYPTEFNLSLAKSAKNLRNSIISYKNLQLLTPNTVDNSLEKYSCQPFLESNNRLYKFKIAY